MAKFKRRRIKSHARKNLEKNRGNIEAEIPSNVNRIKNLGKAVIRHIASGGKRVDIEDYKKRIDVCSKNLCNMRNGRVCTHPQCGCYLDEKAWWFSENCPLAMW